MLKLIHIVIFVFTFLSLNRNLTVFIDSSSNAKEIGKNEHHESHSHGDCSDLCDCRQGENPIAFSYYSILFLSMPNKIQPFTLELGATADISLLIWHPPQKHDLTKMSIKA